MKTLLLCGYRSSDNNEDILGIQRDENHQRLLDLQIQQLSNLGFEVITVLSGEHADEQLRVCPRIANTELVFDTSDSPTLASNLRAGLGATDDEGCFVLPVEIKPPSADVWRFLIQEWHKQGFNAPISILQAATVEGAPWHFGFPLLITRTGNRELRKLQNLLSLSDSRLSYLHPVFQLEATLATGPKAL